MPPFGGESGNPIETNADIMTISRYPATPPPCVAAADRLT